MGKDDTLWCTECDAEHERWAERCAFCEAALSVEPPEPVHIDHSVSEVDVATLELEHREALQLLLRVEAVPHEFHGSVLRVPAGWAMRVNQMVGDVLTPWEPGPGAVGALDEEALATDEPDAEPDWEVASFGKRVVARIVEVVLLGVIVTVLGVLWWSLAGSEPHWLDWTGALWVLVEVVLVARFGWDLGKLLVGLRVVDAEGRPPGWRRALVRTGVLWGPYLVMNAAAAAVVSGLNDSWATVFAVVGVAWVAAVAWSIAQHDQRRGWHDRAAGTWVLE